MAERLKSMRGTDTATKSTPISLRKLKLQDWFMSVKMRLDSAVKSSNWKVTPTMLEFSITLNSRVGQRSQVRHS